MMLSGHHATQAGEIAFNPVGMLALVAAYGNQKSISLSAWLFLMLLARIFGGRPARIASVQNTCPAGGSGGRRIVDFRTLARDRFAGKSANSCSILVMGLESLRHFESRSLARVAILGSPLS